MNHMGKGQKPIHHVLMIRYQFGTDSEPRQNKALTTLFTFPLTRQNAIPFPGLFLTLQDLNEPSFAI